MQFIEQSLVAAKINKPCFSSQVCENIFFGDLETPLVSISIFSLLQSQTH